MFQVKKRFKKIKNLYFVKGDIYSKTNYNIDDDNNNGDRWGR